MTEDFPGRTAGPIDESGLPDGSETRDPDSQGIRDVLTDALDKLDAVQALIDLEQEDRRLEQACDWARRGDRRDTSAHALRYVLLQRLADDLGAPGDAARTR